MTRLFLPLTISMCLAAACSEGNADPSLTEPADVSSTPSEIDTSVSGPSDALNPEARDSAEPGALQEVNTTEASDTNATQGEEDAEGPSLLDVVPLLIASCKRVA